MSFVDELRAIDPDEIARTEARKREEKEQQDYILYKQWVRDKLKDSFLRLRKEGKLKNNPISGVFLVPSFSLYSTRYY